MKEWKNEWKNGIYTSLYLTQKEMRGYPGSNRWHLGGYGPIVVSDGAEMWRGEISVYDFSEHVYSL
jgi:hypothetical protein